MTVNISDFDVTEYLNTEEDMVAYLNAVVEENDPGLLVAAIGDVARARGMSEIARQTGLGRESLYKSLSQNGNPSFATIQKIMAALGAKVSFASAKTTA